MPRLDQETREAEARTSTFCGRQPLAPRLGLVSDLPIDMRLCLPGAWLVRVDEQLREDD